MDIVENGITIRMYVDGYGRAWAKQVSDSLFNYYSWVDDVCWKINREENSLEDALMILEDEGFNTQFSQGE